ncbi:hypothetical protein [Enterobacter sp. NFIX58]|uniref:hypothetical protein n=1 Tax=Enterobacter sp. NFIX58 TaxID=1566251 RepID=UPI0008B115FF|nr:hypothetical protein [Enterobacter sp. NFIX58]SEP40361.1 hypothetical protein SAMN03159286_0179 [Enterobacter sp. NFIX58]
MADLFKEITGIDSKDVTGDVPQLTIWKMDIDTNEDEEEVRAEPVGIFARVVSLITSRLK